MTLYPTNSRKSTLRKVFLTMLPIQSLAVGLTAINTLINGMIIGNGLGQSELAAIGLLNPFNFILSIFSTTIGVGSQMVCGRFLGKGDRENLKNTFSTAMSMAVVTGLIVSGFMFFFAGLLSVLLGANEELYPLLHDYLRGYAFSCLFNILSVCVISFLQMESQRLLSTISVVTLLVLNTGLNLLNILVFKQGMFGAGLATTIANAASVLICLPYFLGKSELFSFSFARIHFDVVKSIVYLGMSSITKFVCLFIRERLTNQVILSIGGTLALSAYTVALNLTTAVGCTIEGGYVACLNLISSVLIGERDVKSLREIGKSINPPTVLLFVIAYAATALLAGPIALLFGAEPENLALYTMMIRIVNLWFLTSCFKNCSLAIYTALGKIKFVTAINVIGFAVVPVVFMGISMLTGNLLPVMLFAVVADIVPVIIYIGYYRKKTGEMPPSINEITYVSREFSVEKENTLSLEVYNSEESVNASRQLIDFCQAKGLSDRDSTFCGLCIEEMTQNILSHGMKKSKDNSGVIELRAFYENGEVTVMMRDDCVKFDPKAWLDQNHPEDPSSAFGIKAVAKAAKEMTYNNTLGLNILTIRI